VAVNLVRFIVAVGALLICAAAPAAELHPIVAVEFGYFFGATANEKWIKAEDAAKSIPDETTYRIYGLTQALGDAKGAKPKPSEEDVCSDVLTVSLSPQPEKGTIALAAPWNALPRKPQVIDRTQKVYVDAVRDFLKTKGTEQPKVKIEDILRVDLDGDGEDEVLISATNYFSEAKGARRCHRRLAVIQWCCCAGSLLEKWKHSLWKANSIPRLMEMPWATTRASTRRMLTK
jgi:hypothetical protein